MALPLDTVQNYTPIDLNRSVKISNGSMGEVMDWHNSTSIQPQYVRKKWSLVKFKRMIKRGGFVSARLTAKTLGVDKRTIEKWLQLPMIQRALVSDISSFTKTIKKSKDWKAQAYLLEATMDTDKGKGDTSDLKQLIVINT